MEYVLVIIVLLGVLARGVYYAKEIAIMCTILSLLVIVTNKARVLKAELALLGLLVATMLSCFINDYGITSFERALTPLMLALFISLYTTLTQEAKKNFIQILLLCAGLFCILGLCAYMYVIPVENWITGNFRLCFSFEYANAAATWFGVTAFLMLQQDEKYLRLFVVPSVCCLFLTQSTAGIGIYALALLAYLYFKHDEKTFCEIVILNGVGAGCSILCLNASGWTSIFIIAIIYLVSFIAIKVMPLFEKTKLYLLGAAGGVGVGFYYLFQLGMGNRGSKTMTERLFQIADGFKGWTHHILFGVGPERWFEVVPTYRSAQYTASTIHCSPMIVLTEIGLLGIIATFIFLFYCFRRKNRDITMTIAACMILVHSLVEFTVYFGSLLILFVVIMFYSEVTQEDVAFELLKEWHIKVYALVCRPLLSLLLALCIILAAANWYKEQLWSYSVEYEDNLGVAVMLGRMKKIIGRELDNDERLMSIYSDANDYMHMLQIASKYSVEFDINSAFITTEGIRALISTIGDKDEELSKLLDKLEENYNDYALVSKTCSLLRDINADAKYIERYNRIIDDINSSHSDTEIFMGIVRYYPHLYTQNYLDSLVE